MPLDPAGGSAPIPLVHLFASVEIKSWLRPCSSSWRQPNCGVQQRASAIFGRAAITLGIGPHF